MPRTKKFQTDPEYAYKRVRYKALQCGYYILKDTREELHLIGHGFKSIVDGKVEIIFRPSNREITTRLYHPNKGITELTRKNCVRSLVEKILKYPRQHSRVTKSGKRIAVNPDPMYAAISRA